MSRWQIIEIVLTLTATGVLMWFIRQRQELGSYRGLVAGLAGIGFLCGLYALGLQSAGYILLGLIALLAVAYLFSWFAE